MQTTNGLDEAALDALCGDWPGVARTMKWEVDLVYSVANRMFAVLCTLGPDRGRLSVRVEPERFLELSERPGLAPAHYMAHAFWISIREPELLPRSEIEAFVRRSYELVRESLPKKARAGLER